MLGFGAVSQHALSDIGTTVNNVQANPTQLVYRPRMLVTLTIAADTNYYSIEDLDVPAAGGAVGIAQVGEAQVGDN